MQTAEACRAIRFALSIVVALAALLFAASPVRATPPVYASCIVTPATPSLCGSAAGPIPLTYPPNNRGIVVSPDGRDVYVLEDDGILVLNLDAATGTVTAKPASAGSARCLTKTGNSGACAADPHLTKLKAIGISSAGTRVYAVTGGATAVSPDSLLVLNRDPATGGLTPHACLTAVATAGCTASDALNGQFVNLVVAPDDTSLYLVGVSSGFEAARVVTVQLDGSGDAGIPAGAAGCVDRAGTAPCAQDTRLTSGGGDEAAVVSPDGKQLYVADTGGVLTYDRTAAGVLTPRAGSSGCISNEGAQHAGCAQGRYVDGLQSMVISPDGRSIYGDDAITVTEIRRQPSTGDLEQAQDASACLIDRIYHSQSRPCTEATAIGGVKDVIVSQNGDSVYVDSALNVGVQGELAHFVRDRQTGALSQPAGPAGCLAAAPDSYSQTVGCGTVPQVGQSYGMALSPDGATLLTRSNPEWTNQQLVVAFKRDVPPVCRDASVTTPFQAPVQVPLNCTDANGDAVTIQVRSQPAKGELGTVDQVNRRVAFAPFPNATGADSFSFFGTANGYDGDPATARMAIGAPPPAPPAAPLPQSPVVPVVFDADGDGYQLSIDCNDRDPSVHPGARDLPGDRIDQDCNGADAPYPSIGAQTTGIFFFSRHWTRIAGLTVKNVVAGATVTVTCKGARACPYKRRAIHVRRAAGKVALGRPFRGRRLAVGTAVEIRVTAPGYVGAVTRYVMRRSRFPRRTALCLAPGARKPERC